MSAVIVMILIAAPVQQSHAKSDLKGNIVSLCYRCHTELKQNLNDKYVHYPYKQGMCDGCHDVHASKHRKLVSDETNALCLSCHDKINKRIVTTNVHGAIRNGICTDCHDPHSENNKALLVIPEQKLCMNCHEKKLQNQFKNTFVHTPFKGGNCSSCHDAHASRQENLLLASPGKVCQSCHAPRCNVGGVSITFATKKMDCTSCHAGHSSTAQSLLGPKGHPAFLSKSCEQCHNTFVAERKVTTHKKGKALCFTCHVNEPSKFNESDVHLSFSDNPCTMCHDYHASNRDNMTVNEPNVCNQCHQDTYNRIDNMEKTIKQLRCEPVKEKKCFGCHTPMHSSEPIYFRKDVVATCSECHEAQHRVSHPVGEGIIDPRDGETLTCRSCHGMHSGRARFMLQFERDRELCIQCHKT